MEDVSAVQIRVARGAALLDVERPGWYKEIDLGKLELYDGCKCVLGQLYDKGGWNDENVGREALGLPGFFYGRRELFGNPEERGDQVVEHGFSVHGDIKDEWNLLDDLWIAEIKARRDADKTHQWCVDCEEHLPVAEFDSPEDDLCIDCRQDAFADAHMSMEIGAAV